MYEFIFLTIYVCVFVERSKAATCVYQDAFIDYTCQPFIANSNKESLPFIIEGDHIFGKDDANVTEVFAESSIIETFPNEILQKFNNLRKLHLHEVGMKVLKEPLDNCGSLVILDLRVNEINSIPPLAFLSCANLS